MVLPCWFRRRSRGWARNGRAVKALPYGWNQQINFLVRSTDPVAEARTHRKKRDVCATRGLVLAARAHPTVGNEAGMCPGINRFTKCAPIADWVRRGVPLWCSRVGLGGAPVVGA